MATPYNPQTPVGKVDPNVQLPPAVAAAAARANALLEAQNQPAPQDLPTPQDPPVTPAGNEPPHQHKPIESVPVTPAAQPTPPPSDDETWEQRYKAMKGRFDKSQDQINTLVGEVNNLRAVLGTMEARPAQHDPNNGSAFKPKKLITPEEEQDYGEEFFTVVEKKARELIEPLQEQYEQRYQQLEQRIQGVGTQVVQGSLARMEQQLDKDIPSWRSTNADWENNGFKEWLQLPDPYSGAIRHTLLNAAYERCDAPRVAAFFKGFHAEVAATAPGNGSDPNPASLTPKVPLTQFAAPGRAKSAAQQLPAEKPFITRSQIAQHYRDITAGRYRGREAEQRENEQIIFDAQREGRILD